MDQPPESFLLKRMRIFSHLFITYIGAFLVCPVSTNLGGFLFNLKTRIFQTYDHIAFPKKWFNRLKVDFELCHR